LRYCLTMLVLWTMILSAVACGRAFRQPTLSDQFPEVDRKTQVGEEPPLLLEDAGAAQHVSPSDAPVADNSRCHVCHINYEDEKLAVVHARANIGCERCHGSSDAHCSDEDHLTPPDVMYPLAKINPACMKCHTQNKIDLIPHRPLFDGTAAEGGKHCTDCHGDHRLERRMRKWDKTTGKLE